ncbi:MAG: glutathione peroxidase [Tenuifilaceae bacterium]
MKILTLASIVLLFVGSVNAQTKSFYDFTVKSIDGSEFKLSQLKGKKVMVVNTASKCGYTPQYETLEQVYEKYKSKNFVIVGFPANNFGSQEPGTNKEIREFCTEKYGVNFLMMEKISVKGDDIHPLYKWLTSKAENGVMDSEVKWNFQKYLIDESGKLINVLPSKEKPDSEKVIAWIEGK